MDLKSVLFYANTLFLFSIVLEVVAIAAGNDQQALLVFKEKVVNDPFGSLNSWNSSVPLYQWHGVTCSHRHRERVVALRLRHQGLTGSLSPYIGNLSFLKKLDLSNNSFSQHIPSQLGYLTRLRYLYLQNNSFEGEIPANISACTKLVYFWASKNKLSGMLPIQLGSLSMLESLNFGSNNLVGGIPVSYGNLSSLKTFFLYENTLSGKVLNALGKLAKLQYLDFLLNSFSGIVPFSLFNITSLKTLDLSINQLSGTIPRDLGTTLPELEFFSIRGNHFSGSLPVSLSNMSSLWYLAIDNNKFSGEVPDFSKLLKLTLLGLGDNQFNCGNAYDLHVISSLKNATRLTKLYLENIGFVGRFSDSSFKNLSTTLDALNLAGNKIYGNIPVWILKYVNLQVLHLSNNQFSGIIPQEIGKLQSLQGLFLHQNRISGFIPSSVSNLTVLTHLALSENILVGKIPSSLGRCQSLLYLYLDGNNLIGSIPRELFSISSLVHLFLSDNQLRGKLPEEVGELKNLIVLNISSNRFSAEIPSTLGSCVMLEYLYMEGNLFQGIIPNTFEALKSLELLDLSLNNLSGQIPKFLKDFKLQMLNLSFNNFEGAIPIGGVFQNLSVVSVSNNTRLCGGLPAFGLPKCNSNNKHSSKFVSSSTFKLVISLVLGFLGLVTMIVLLLIFRSKRKFSTSDNTNPNQLLMISYQEILRATNGFSESNLIGVGSYGSVYKGILDDDDHSIVAVKVLNLSQRGASKSFMAECDVLRSIRHRNLVKVITTCSSIDYNDDEFKALIYEFMAKGNLDEWLHTNALENSDTSKRLSFSQRLTIAIDVANALDYLHNDCETSIVHCDLKPSNVLLDNELAAHVGDFGLAKILTSNSETSAVPATSSSIIKGSIGYTAPEYGMGSKPSTHSDVYSFGILLLEMFTGKRPSDDMFRDEMDLYCLVKNALPDNVVEVADPHLLEDWEPDNKRTDTQENVRLSREAHKQIEGLISIFRLGVACSSYSLNERQNMKDVVRKLCSIRDVYTSKRVPVTLTVNFHFSYSLFFS